MRWTEDYCLFLIPSPLLKQVILFLSLLACYTDVEIHRDSIHGTLFFLLCTYLLGDLI